MNAPMASETPSSSAVPATSSDEPDEADREQFVVVGVDQSPDERRALSGDDREHEEEPERLRDRDDRVADAFGVADDGLQCREVEGEEQVFDDDDAEDEPRLSVGEPVQFDEEFGDDRGRRDPDRARDDEGLAVAPAEREAEGESGADVEREVDASREDELAPALDELVDGELEPEVEEQEDEAERGDELEVGGIGDEVESRGVRPEDDARRS